MKTWLLYFNQTYPNKENFTCFSWMCQVFRCASHLALQRSVWFDLIFQPYHLFLPPTNTHTSIFLYLFHFSNLSFTLIPLPTTSRMSQCYTDIHSENPTKIQTPKMKSSRASLWVHVPLSRQAVHDHTAAVRLTDLWHRIAQCRTQNPSQGADACFLLTYAPEIEQGEGGGEMEGKAEDNRGRGRRRESVNLEEQWGSWKRRKGRLRLEKCKSKAKKTQKKNLRANLIVNNTPTILHSKAILPQLCQSSFEANKHECVKEKNIL